MAEIGNLGLSTLPHLDAATADPTAAAQQLGIAKNMIAPVASPLPNLDQSKITGSTAVSSDSLRLESRGKWGPTQVQVTHLASALKRFEQPGTHPFSGIAEKAVPILRQQYQFMTQIAAGFSHGRT